GFVRAPARAWPRSRPAPAGMARQNGDPTRMRTIGMGGAGLERARDPLLSRAWRATARRVDHVQSDWRLADAPRRAVRKAAGAASFAAPRSSSSSAPSAGTGVWPSRICSSVSLARATRLLIVPTAQPQIEAASSYENPLALTRMSALR